MEYKKSKKKFSLYDQKRIALAVQERKRKYEEDKKNPEIASSSKVSQKDEEEHHEENCSDMFDWLCLTMFLG